jgi:hypothetical protein
MSDAGARGGDDILSFLYYDSGPIVAGFFEFVLYKNSLSCVALVKISIQFLLLKSFFQ